MTAINSSKTTLIILLKLIYSFYYHFVDNFKQEKDFWILRVLSSRIFWINIVKIFKAMQFTFQKKYDILFVFKKYIFDSIWWIFIVWQCIGTLNVLYVNRIYMYFNTFQYIGMIEPTKKISAFNLIPLEIRDFQYHWTHQLFEVHKLSIY